MSGPRTHPPADRCPACDYSWAGLPPRGACPECGFAYDERTYVFTSISGGVQPIPTAITAAILLGTAWYIGSLLLAALPVAVAIVGLAARLIAGKARPARLVATPDRLATRPRHGAIQSAPWTPGAVFGPWRTFPRRYTILANLTGDRLQTEDFRVTVPNTFANRRAIVAVTRYRNAAAATPPGADTRSATLRGDSAP